MLEATTLSRWCMRRRFFRHFILRAHFPTALHDNSTKEIMLLKVLHDYIKVNNFSSNNETQYKFEKIISQYWGSIRGSRLGCLIK